ncbi:MAG: uracil-DNA glycosylase [Erysipelotrichaceae bacterium]|nr:uracil-DNA glycosylase [Erysipelotrichaceae bacterium]MCI9312957.1 uracil-DNA glycosylase [Erysipelotrichaceae bacterium]
MNWQTFFEQEQTQPYFQELMDFVKTQYAHKTIYPPQEQLFSAFALCPYEQVRVVILGQDPYHEVNQAHGLAFSVSKGVKIPPSLRNIYKELQADIGIEPPKHGYLVDWAKQGVFLCNAILSVEQGKAGSHRKKGWEIFSDHLIQALNQAKQPIVFLLWGAFAQSKQSMIDAEKHLVLCAPHPSPLSAYQGFFGSKPFSQANAFLKEKGRGEIDWRISQ